MAKLVCISGMNKDDEFALTEGANTMGRSAECDIVLFDKKCSRKHSQVFKKGNYFAIEDLESRHGTKLNHKPVTKRQSLKIGDKVQLGRTTLLLSDRAMGDLITQTASDAAADLEGGRGYEKLIGSAAADVKSHMLHEEPVQGGFKGFIRRMFDK